MDKLLLNECFSHDDPKLLMEALDNTVIDQEYYITAAKFGAFKCIKAMYDKQYSELTKEQAKQYTDYSNKYAEFLKEISASRIGQANKRMAAPKTSSFTEPRLSLIPEGAYLAAFDYARNNNDDLSTVKMLMALGIPCDESIRTILKGDKKMSGYDAIVHTFLFKRMGLAGNENTMKNVDKRKDLLNKAKRLKK